MINKLKNKISLIIVFSLTIPLIIGIVFFDFSYYSNIINSSKMFVERFFERPGDNHKNIKKDEIIDVKGIYLITINNNQIISNDDNIPNEIKEYTNEIINKSNQSGIIGNYIYKKRIIEMKDHNIDIIFIESTNEINKIKIVLIISLIILSIGIGIIYFLAKKIAGVIVKPVAETFNKQREFISDASHELKTPLAVITANADVLENEIGENKWLNYIQNETDNMEKLIGELLLLSQIENIDKLREPEKFNISNHIELVVSSFESMAYEKKVVMHTNIQKDIITEKYNRDDITHILSTLIDNAIKHTKEKNTVIVEFIKNKDEIIINVKNQGKEIPLVEREKIFDRFYRIDKSRNRSEKRYGLGLAIAKAIVIKNNGTIKVLYKDGYTIFMVELPS